MDIPMFGRPVVLTLKISGLWPDYGNKIAIILTSSVLFGLVPFQCWEMFRERDDPILLSDSLITIIAQMLLYIKFFILLFHKSNLIAVIREMSDDYKRAVKFSKLAKYSQRFGKFVYAAYTSTCLLYFVQFIVMLTMFPIEERQMILRAYYPFDYKSSPVYEMMNIVIFIQSMFMICVQALSESLLIALVFDICEQIDLLINQIELYSMRCDIPRKYRTLVPLIERHVKILDKVNKLEIIYTYIAMVQVLFSTVIICLIGFGILTIGSSQAIVVMKYSMLYMNMTWQAYSFCYAGQHLIDKNDELRGRLYDISWYNIEVAEMKILLFILQRVLAPLQLTAGKFSPISAQTFTSIMKSSFSFLSVLRACYSTMEPLESLD